jgi:7-cyano-7-deazaguanine synthase
MKDSGYFLYSPTHALIIVVKDHYRRRHMQDTHNQGGGWAEGGPNSVTVVHHHGGAGSAYAAEQLRQIQQQPFKTSFMPEVDMSDGVAIVSGGMDSITMVHMLVKEFGLHPHMVSFDYGQRHKKELNFALWNAEQLGLRWSLIDLSSLTDLIATSALTSKLAYPLSGDLTAPASPVHPGPREIEVPEGHYAQDNMAITVVPNRNMMMMSIAAAVAVSNEGHYLAAGMHAGDHYQYPDCRPDFIDSFMHTLQWANEGFLQRDFDVKTPFINLTKNDIAAAAYKYEVPLASTWSCYKGDLVHCGRCGTCVERLEAIDSVVEAPPGWDQTVYSDKEFWKQAIAEGLKS